MTTETETPPAMTVCRRCNQAKPTAEFPMRSVACCRTCMHAPRRSPPTYPLMGPTVGRRGDEDDEWPPRQTVRGTFAIDPAHPNHPENRDVIARCDA